MEKIKLAKTNFLRLPQWLQSSVFYRSKLKRHSGEKWESNPCEAVHPYDANLISSENAHGTHYLMLDLDHDHWYHESSTQGHGHLVIRKELELYQLIEIVNVLVRHGVLQEGIKMQLDDRGCLTLRMPGMKKDVPEDNMSIEQLKDRGIIVRPVEEKNIENDQQPLYHSGGWISDIKDFFS